MIEVLLLLAGVIIGAVLGITLVFHVSKFVGPMF